MKLIIEVDEKRFEEIKQIANAQFELKNKTEAQIIAHGTPYNPTGDCISREALKEKLKERYYNDGLNIVTAIELIDNAPPVPQVTVFTENADEKAVADMKAELQSVIGARPNEQIAWEQGYEAGLAQGKQDALKGDLIRRSDALKAVDNRHEELLHDTEYRRKHCQIDLLGIKKHILAIPPVDAIANTTEVRPQNKWIKIFENPFTNGYVCPFCGHKIQVTEQFLPKVTECESCGADMRGEEDEKSD